MPATEPKRRYRVVVALDTSDYAPAVLEYALDQAARHEGPDLNVIAVVEPARTVVFDEVARVLRDRVHELLLATMFTFGAASDWRVRIHVRQGVPAEEIASLVDEVQADLLVVGRFGASPPRRGRRGSVADDVLRLAACPTLVVQIPDYVHVDADIQCADCVTVRRETDGERWFCDEHLASPDARLGLVATLLPHADWGLGGGLMG
jgi:nucleotide-binding universal stress UspA family protein